MAAMVPNWESLRAEWWALLRDIGFRGEIRVVHRDGETRVAVEARYPHLRPRRTPRYRVTTERQFLDRVGFPSVDLRDAVAKDADKERCRALFCWDLRFDRTLAALSFHIDDSNLVPPIVTDLAIRADEHHAHSRFAAVMLLDHLLEILERDTKRLAAPREVGAVSHNDTEAERYRSIGLRPCNSPPHYDHTGTYVCWRRIDRIVTRPRRVQGHE